MSNIEQNKMDKESRNDIVQKIETNLFVEAGAGSGKTTMLVNRMIAMIEAGKPVEKICAITFTKNAALEFYERFQAKLIERINPKNDKPAERAGDLGIPTKEGRERCQKALENIDLCFMGTIDSFCNMILSEHPTEADIPSDARLMNNDEAKEIYKAFYVEIRKNKYPELKKLSDRFNMFFYNPEEMFAHLIGRIMDGRNVTFHYDEDLCIDFFQCFNKQIKDIQTVLDKFSQDKSKIVLSLSDETLDPIEEFENLNAKIQKGWNYNYKGVEITLNKLKDISYQGTKEELGLTNESVIRNEQGGEVVTLNIADPENPQALIYKLQNYKYQNTMKFLLACVEPLETLLKKDGKFTFFDYLLFLRNMLYEDSKKEGKLISYIYNRHSYFLIDEFQDTNPMQAEVFFYLSAKDPKQESWKNCKPKDGSLFIVGDPKQSIYRFRNADVSSYISIRKLFEDNKDNCEVKYLVNNFRSKNDVKNFFNVVFDEVMPEDTLEQSKYKEIANCDSDENENEFKGIYKYECYSKKLLEDYPDMSDSEQMAKVILSIMNSDKKIIDTDKSSPTYNQLRKIKFSDFMLIFYNKKVIGECIAMLKSYNIPTKVEGKVLFNESDGLKAITSIYRTITQRENNISLVETLKCPVFSFNENDLSKYRKEGKTLKLDLSKEYLDKGIEEALNKLVCTARLISNQTPSSLFEMIIDEYNIFNYVSSESLEVIYYVLELLRGEEQNGNIITYDDANDYLDNLINGNAEQERCLSLKQDIDAVHIANLHKVKGLEAPIVLLAKSGVNNKISAGIRIEYNNDSNTNASSTDGYVCSISEPDNGQFKAIETNSLQDIAEKEVNSLKKEVDRLIYVAATRAKNVLIICDTQRTYGKSKEPKSSGKSNQWHYLLEKATGGKIFDVVEENTTPISQRNNIVNSKDLYDNVELTNINSVKTYDFKKPSDIQITPKAIETPINEGITKENNTDSTLIGTIVHRLMEMIIMSKDKLSKDVLIKNIIDEYVTIEYEDKKDRYKSILESIFETIHNGGYIQKNNVPQDILPILLKADSVYSEVPFSYKDNQTIWNGIIDLIYIKDNKVHIIDWKTNKDDTNLDEHYKDQLNAYKAAVKQTLNLDVEDALIYHIDIKN